MRGRKLVALFIIIDILVFALLYYIFFRPTKYREERIDFIKTVVPDWKYEDYKSSTWKGRFYKSLFSRFSIYWHSPPEFEKFFSGLELKMKDISYKEDLPLFDRGVFYYQKRGKEGFDFVFLFGRKERIYWVSLSGSIFSSKDKEILRKFFENLEIEGESVKKGFFWKFEEIFENLPLPKTKRSEFFFFIVFIILIGSQLFILGIFHFMGRCPKKLEEDIITCSSNASVETRNTLQVQIQPACICLKHGFLVVYMGGKKSMEIPLDNVQWNLKKKQGRYENKIFKIPELNEWRTYLPLRPNEDLQEIF